MKRPILLQGGAARTRAATRVAERLPAVRAARLASIDGDVAVLDADGPVRAELDPSVEAVVLAGALRHGERVLVEEHADGRLVVIGVLRTRATPGVDEADEYTIRAKRLRLVGDEEVSMTTATAGIVVRLLGEVETYAERIVSRAEGVHKIIGRMLRLN